MRSSTAVLLASTTLGGTTPVKSAGLKVNQIYVATIQAYVVGSVFAGAYQIEATCEPGKSNDQTGATIPDAQWFTIGSPVTIAAAGSTAVNLNDIGYQWVRVSFVPNSGTGTVAFSASYKGV